MGVVSGSGKGGSGGSVSAAPGGYDDLNCSTSMNVGIVVLGTDAIHAPLKMFSSRELR